MAVSLKGTGTHVTYKPTESRTFVWAYHLQTVRISGPPSLDSVRYDIDATSAGAADREEHRTMLQELLTDRRAKSNIPHRQAR
jgi:uncharacterized protein (TIGR03435 family)